MRNYKISLTPDTGAVLVDSHKRRAIRTARAALHAGSLHANVYAVTDGTEELVWQGHVREGKIVIEEL